MLTQLVGGQTNMIQQEQTPFEDILPVQFNHADELQSRIDLVNEDF